MTTRRRGWASSSRLTADPPSESPKAQEAWQKALASLQKTGERNERAFARHRTAIRRERADPPPMIKKGSFCGAAAVDGFAAGD